MMYLIKPFGSTVALILLLGGVGAVEVVSDCFEGNRFLLFDDTQKDNADQAQERCRSFDANLARITTKEQFDFGLNFILATTQNEPNPPDQIWIGLRDFGDNNLAGTDPARFTFTDGVNGEDRSFINDVSTSGPWFAGQPNDFGTQDCVGYNLEAGKIGLADFACGNFYRGLCRLPCPAPTSSPTDSPSFRIPTTSPSVAPTNFPSASPSTPRPTRSPSFPQPTAAPTSIALENNGKLLGIASVEVFAGFGGLLIILVAMMFRSMIATRKRRKRRERAIFSQNKEENLEECRPPKGDFARAIFYNVSSDDLIF